jgi:GntR family transcriptional regulator
MDFIDFLDSRPIYIQIAERYKTLILKGVLEPDEQLPSVRQMAIELSTNPNTVQRAYMELEKEGFIYTVKGRGNFVRDNKEVKNMKRKELVEKIKEVLREAEEVGIDPEDVLSEAAGKQ